MLQKVTQLKSLAAELEAQVQDYENLNLNYEKKEAKWSEDRWVQVRVQVRVGLHSQFTLISP